MKINRIQFDKIKMQWELLKNKSAIVAANRELDALYNVEDPISFQVNEDGSWNIMESQEPHPVETLSPKQLKKRQIEEIEKAARELLEDEKYELLQEAYEIWNILKSEYDAL